RLPGSAAGWTIADASLPGLRRLLKHFLKPCGVLRQLPARLAADDKRGEELADPVAFELQGGGHPWAGPGAEGSTRPRALGVTGMPPEPRTSQVLGGVSPVMASVACTGRGPTRRVTMAFEPVRGGDWPSGCTDTTLPCQWPNCAKSVA